MTSTRKDQICALLKGIETGEEASVVVVNPDKYIQHNPQTREGGVGLAVLFKRLSKSSPRVNIVRVFEVSKRDLGKRRGRLTMSTERAEIMLIDEARLTGARQSQACKIIGISTGILQRWQQENTHDGRIDAKQPKSKPCQMSNLGIYFTHA